MILVLLALLQSDVGVVSGVKVTTDKVADVSSLEAWKASFIKPGMSDEEKAMAAWRTALRMGFSAGLPTPASSLCEKAAHEKSEPRRKRLPARLPAARLRQLRARPAQAGTGCCSRRRCRSRRPA